MAMLLVFILVPFFLQSQTYVFTLVGGSLGAISACVVIIGITVTPEVEQNSSLILLYWRAICDMGLGVRFLTYHLWNLYTCGQFQCHIVNPDGSYTSYQDRCNLPSAVLEFFELASEGWFICLAIDLAITISNPFSAFSDRLRKYHAWAWIFGLTMALILGISDDLHGFWYVTPEIDNNTFCWIKSHRSTSINFRPFVMFYIPLVTVYFYAMSTLVVAFSRLQNGISKTFQHRVKVLILNSINITVYILYWSVLLLIYALVNDVSVNSISEKYLYRLLMFTVSGKGFADLFVYILIVDTSNIMAELVKGEGGRGLDLNQALRMEVLYYATTGIRKSAQRGPTVKADQKRFAFTMAQKAGEKAANHFTVWNFILIMFGYKEYVAKLLDNSAATSDANADVSSNPLMSAYNSSSSGGDDHSLETGIPMVRPRGTENEDIDKSDAEVTRESEVSVSDFEDDDDTTMVGRSSSSLSSLSSSLFGSTPAQQAKVVFTEYAPYSFRKIRLESGVSDHIYESSFKTTIKERLTEGGASGAFFFFSMGEKFLAKSCTETEMEMLVENAAKYASFLGANPNSFITRIYGAYKLHIYGTDLYFFVMSNILLTLDDESLNEKYDLKGSWVARNSAPPQAGQRATCCHCNQKFIYHRRTKKSKKAQVALSTDGRSSHSGSAENVSKMLNDDVCPMTVHGYHEPNVIMKDNDLKYKIRLPHDTALSLYVQLRKDAHFLCHLGIMDYSLLVGVHNHEYDVDISHLSPPALEAGTPELGGASTKGKNTLKRRASTVTKDSSRGAVDEDRESDVGGVQAVVKTRPNQLNAKRLQVSIQLPHTLSASKFCSNVCVVFFCFTISVLFL